MRKSYEEAREKKRLRAITSKFVISPQKCRCCNEEVRFEKMWFVLRYGTNKRVHSWYYCKNCMHSAEEVLNEIDTDENEFGIANVDSFLRFTKKDPTKLNKKNEYFMARIKKVIACKQKQMNSSF